MKKVLSIVLAAAMMLCLAVPALAASAVRSGQSLTVDGKAVSCDIYNIDGSNYFKLRDLAYLLNGTASQFAVGYDSEKNCVTVTTGAAYEPNGSELEIGDDLSSSAVPGTQAIYIDGVQNSELSAYNIGGSNFFKLRDLGSAVGFRVDYDAAAGTMIVESAGYTAGTLAAGDLLEIVGGQMTVAEAEAAYPVLAGRGTAFEPANEVVYQNAFADGGTVSLMYDRDGRISYASGSFTFELTEDGCAAAGKTRDALEASVRAVISGEPDYSRIWINGRRTEGASLSDMTGDLTVRSSRQVRWSSAPENVRSAYVDFNIRPNADIYVGVAVSR